MRGHLAAAAALVVVLGTSCRPEDAATERAIVSRSIAFFETRLTADSNNYLVAGRLASRYLTRFALAADPEDLSRAEALSLRLVRIAPDRAKALSRLSGVLLARHRFAEALAAARDAVAAGPRDPDALGALFDASLATGGRTQAEQALGAMRPGGLETLVRRAQWLDATGHGEGARLTMDRVCRRLARSAGRPAALAWCLTELAGMEHRVRGPGAAEATLRRALEVEPGYRGAVEGLADLAAARGDWATAQAHYRRIATDAHPDLYLRLAETADAMNRGPERARWERRFLDLASAPELEPLYGGELALFLVERGRPGDLDRALGIARRETERRPTAQSFDLLTWVRLRRGELDQALAASERSRALEGESPTLDYHRARIFESMGRRGEALPLLARALAEPSLLPPYARRDAEGRRSTSGA